LYVIQKSCPNILQTLQFQKRRKYTVALNMSAVSARLIASKGTKVHDIKHTAAVLASQWTLSSPRLYAPCFSSWGSWVEGSGQLSKTCTTRQLDFHWTPIFSRNELRYFLRVKQPRHRAMVFDAPKRRH